jgi:hypothetical protein
MILGDKDEGTSTQMNRVMIMHEKRNHKKRENVE